MKPKRIALNAFSLLECLIVLALLALALGMSVGTWQGWHQNQQANLALQQLHQALVTSQSLAIARQHPLTLCPSIDQRHCQSTWSGTLLLFDPSQPTPIADFPWKNLNGSWQWRNFRRQAWLTFTADGHLLDNNGTFVYCPHDGQMAFMRALSINQTGRIRVVHQRDSAGQLLDSEGHAIGCNRV